MRLNMSPVNSVNKANLAFGKAIVVQSESYAVISALKQKDRIW